MEAKQPIIARLVILMGVMLFAGAVFAGESSTLSKEEIAKELANPNTALTSLKLQIQYFS